MNSSLELLYKMRCDFNMECSLIYEFWFELIGRKDYAKIFVISADINENDLSNKFSGFVKPIKELVRSELG